jgi:proline racemase
LHASKDAGIVNLDVPEGGVAAEYTMNGEYDDRDPFAHGFRWSS